MTEFKKRGRSWLRPLLLLIAIVAVALVYLQTAFPRMRTATTHIDFGTLRLPDPKLIIQESAPPTRLLRRVTVEVQNLGGAPLELKRGDVSSRLEISIPRNSIDRLATSEIEVRISYSPDDAGRHLEETFEVLTNDPLRRRVRFLVEAQIVKWD
jgi:hypothetical protein